MNLSIPDEFNSDSDDQPFRNCKICNCDLTGDVVYTVEKAYKQIDEERKITLFEVALCLPCAEEQSNKMSDESRQYMEKMMGGNGFMEKRHKSWDSDWRKSWKESCLITGEPVKLNDEFHVVGQFKGGELIPYATPFVIGQALLEEIQENLSFETKEEMDRFGEQFLGPDPSIRELLPDYQIILV